MLLNLSVPPRRETWPANQTAGRAGQSARQGSMEGSGPEEVVLVVLTPLAVPADDL